MERQVHHTVSVRLDFVRFGSLTGDELSVKINRLLLRVWLLSSVLVLQRIRKYQHLIIELYFIVLITTLSYFILIFDWPGEVELVPTYIDLPSYTLLGYSLDWNPLWVKDRTWCGVNMYLIHLPDRIPILLNFLSISFMIFYLTRSGAVCSAVVNAYLVRGSKLNEFVRSARFLINEFVRSARFLIKWIRT